MFRFANIEMLWWLITIPVFVMAYIIYTKRKQRQLAEFGDPELLAQLMPDASKVRPIWKFSLLIVALILLIVAAARPQYGQKEKTVKRQGIEVMVALDISNSMLAEDVAPNRLDRAKQMLSKMIDNMVDDKVGLVVFAGEAFTQLPITCDYVSAKMFLHTITPNLIQTQGTAIGAALQTAVTSFGVQESDAGRAIILITDGENHEDDAIAAAKKAQELGIQVFVIGIGKPEGSPIPKPGTTDYFKDRSGQVVVSKLNEDMCRQISQSGGGIYVRCDNTNTAMRALQQELDRIATADLETTVYADYNEQYQSFVLMAMLLLVIEFFILSRKNHRLTRMDLFKENSEKK
jgi:Ca-activated chloride channel family protein